jgi:hypothetical protein
MYVPLMERRHDPDRGPEPAPERSRARREPGAGTPAGPDALLDLQRKAGNRAVASYLTRTPHSADSVQLQRWKWPSLDWEDVVDAYEWVNPLTVSGKLVQKVTGVEPSLWTLAEQAVRASATKITIPQSHIDALKRYAAAHDDDGRILLNALDQDPSYYKGGWLLDMQGDAEAITFGNSIFFGASPPSARTFVHEMVHIDQYARLGRTAFLESYFGSSLLTIIKRAIAHEPINVMMSSPHEREAYALESRFAASK